MTIEEALKKMRLMSCCEIEVPIKEYVEIMHTAIEALEKQIPKKPTLEGDGYADGQMVYDTWFCPCCDTYYEVDFDDYMFCPNCGQKLDWSNENV